MQTAVQDERAADAPVPGGHTQQIAGAAPGAVPDDVVDETRRRFPGTLILAGDYDATRAETDLAAGRADLIAFGRPFIANPDLPARLAAKAPLADMQADKLYTPGPEGYSDFPALSESAAA